MKLSNLTVVFLIIAIVIIAVLGSYIKLQVDTVNMQNDYNTKLLDATREAIDAFETNTVKWNDRFTDTAGFKRKAVNASINTFVSSFASKIGVTGTAKENMLSYIPAIAYTLYNGYYIYTPATVKEAILDENEVRVIMTEKLLEKTIDGNKLIDDYTFNESDEGKILYYTEEVSKADGKYYYYDGNKDEYSYVYFTFNAADAKETEFKHILKPFVAYSERAQSSEGDDVIIDYTLDNYVYVYGYLKDADGNQNFISKSGYLSALGDEGKINIKYYNRKDYRAKNYLEGITYNGSTITPETLSEEIAYEDDAGNIIMGSYKYVYEAENDTKVYFESDGRAFILQDDAKKIYLGNGLERYKKICIPTLTSGNEINYKERYQGLSDGKWYRKEGNSDQYIEVEPGDITNYIQGVNLSDKTIDYSAINYCVESYLFTDWFNSINLTATSVELDENGDTNVVEPNVSLTVNKDNDPEDEDSQFTKHKRYVIKYVIESNLNQAITSYSRNTEGEYRLPKLTETDWDKILNNVSIITFIQNIPMGLKQYNNYAISSSTLNKEFVKPSEIYLYSKSDTSLQYHRPYCKELNGDLDDLIGYRSIDFIKRETDVKSNQFYFRHRNNDGQYVSQDCYNCLIQRTMYSEEITTKKAEAYNTALAREKYISKMAKLPAEAELTSRIDVETVDLLSPNPITDAEWEYSIGEGENIEYIGQKMGAFSIPLTVKNVFNTFYISSITGSETEISGSTKYGTLEDPIDAIEYTKSEWTKYKPKTTKENEKMIFITELTDYYLKYKTNYVEDESNEVNSNDWLTVNWLNNSYETTPNDGIKVKLYYEKNSPSRLNVGEVYANINAKNSLTIVTSLKDIEGKGKVKLEYVNGEKHYSTPVIELNPDSEGKAQICTRINNDTNWYNDEWQVIVHESGDSSLGSGSVSYYTIRDKNGLAGFAEATNENAKTEGRKFRLESDITSISMQPICSANWFNGEFIGNSHTVSNITIQGNGTSFFGFFGGIGENSTISDLTIDGISVDKSGADYVGGLTGYNKSSKLNSIVVNNPSVKGKNYVGGFIGRNDASLNGLTMNQNTTGTVSGVEMVGGFFGYNSGANLSGLTNNCTIKGSGQAIGGIVGYNLNKNITSCNNNGKIKGAKSTGGIVGFFDGTAPKTISVSDCYNSGAITGTNSVGGIVGSGTGGGLPSNHVTRKIERCSNTAKITGTGGTIEGILDGTGGIVGSIEFGDIQYSFNRGKITADHGGAGIAGAMNRTRVLGCYNTAKVTGSKEGERSYGGITGIASLACSFNYCYSTGSITYKRDGTSYYAGGITGVENCDYSRDLVSNYDNCYYTKGVKPYMVWSRNLARNNWSV